MDEWIKYRRIKLEFFVFYEKKTTENTEKKHAHCNLLTKLDSFVLLSFLHCCCCCCYYWSFSIRVWQETLSQVKKNRFKSLYFFLHSSPDSQKYLKYIFQLEFLLLSILIFLFSFHFIPT